MKAFTVETAKLLSALAFAVETDGESMLLESSGERLCISAVGPGSSFTTAIDALCADPLTACVRTKQVLDLIRHLTADVVTFQRQGGVIAVTTAHGLRYRLLTMRSDDLPVIDSVEAASTPISGPLLASMLSTVAFAAETNPNGEERWKALELAAKGGVLSITACCGFQLANAEVAFDGEFYALVPAQNVSLLVRLAGASESLDLAMNGHLLTAQSPVGTVNLRLSALMWPDWRRLIGPVYTHTAQCDVAALKTALSRLLLFCDNDIVRRVGCEWGSDKLTLTVTSPERGEGREEVVGQNGDPFTLAMDGKRLMGLLRTLKDAMTWEMTDGAPVRFTVDTQQPFTFQCVQLPMR